MGEKAKSGMRRDLGPDLVLGFPSRKTEKAVEKTSLGGEATILINLPSRDVDWAVDK